MEDQLKEKRFGKLIDEAMKDEFWLELITMKTRLPLRRRGQEIAEIFKRHVVLMGKDTEIYSVKDAKNYFANYTRRGTATYKELVEELRQHNAAAHLPEGCGEDPYRYEDIDPQTGERSYCGIQIPADAPPRPSENAVYVNGEWTV